MQWLGLLEAGGHGGPNGRSGLSVDGTQAPDQGFKTSSFLLDIPVEGGDQTFYNVLFHFEVYSGGNRNQFSQSGPPKDTLIERWEIHYQKLSLDGSGGHPSSEGDDQLDIPPKFGTGPIEALDV